MLVMKFGGTSVEDAAAIRNVAAIVTCEIDRSPLVLVSACAGMTNTLLRAARFTASGQFQESLAEIEAIKQRHLGIARELGLNDKAQKDVLALLADLEALGEQRIPSPAFEPQLSDHFASFGERLSSLLLHGCLTLQGTITHLIDARDIIVTDDQFTSAIPQFSLIEEKTASVCKPLLVPGTVVVTQGFIGATQDGLTTTIGRGGSDYSAAIFGAALGAEEIQIWTDVDGILTADPSLLPEAHRIKHLTFREAAELAYFGARVLHPKTILPAFEKGIPVRVLNSKRPKVKGTLIARDNVQSADCVVKSVAYKEGITLVNIESTRMLMAYGFLARVFEVFAHHGKSVDVVVTSEIGVSLTIDDAKDLDKIQVSLSEFADVTVHPNRAVVCLVGENMRTTRGVAAKIFSALDKAGVNAELISHGGSDINLTLVIREEEILPAVKSLHEEFFEKAEKTEGIFY